MTKFKRGAIVEPISDCKSKGKRGVVLECDTLLKKSLVHIFKEHTRDWYNWQNLKLLSPSTSAIVSYMNDLPPIQIYGAAGLVKSS